MKITWIVVLLSLSLCVLQISDLYAFPVTFYEPVNVQNRMCELCTFSQIRSQMCLHFTKIHIDNGV